MERMPIGEFSRLVRLSAKALRLYDRLGLLTPHEVDPWTGYRFYAPSQARRARAIALLRRIDMPLPEIAALLAAPGADDVQALLERHRAALEERLVRHRQMLARAETLIEQGGVMETHVTEKTVDPVTLCGFTFTADVESIGEESGAAYGRVYQALAEAGTPPIGPPWLLYHDMDPDHEEWELEVGVPVPDGTAEPAAGLTVRRHVPGRVAAAVHRGPYDELGLAYRELETWVAEHGRSTAGPLFDIYLNDPAHTDPADLETQVCWPIG
ncbi:MAG: MerR family transcriptional regulator [Euzebyales bacterium]|jgi:DNA-binding transcriptional MerR regulator|nr:MerR family transcriptional regulator [Euzebyales bacterium]